MYAQNIFEHSIYHLLRKSLIKVLTQANPHRPLVVSGILTKLQVSYDGVDGAEDDEEITRVFLPIHGLDVPENKLTAQRLHRLCMEEI